MDDNKLAGYSNRKLINATRWSTFTEIVTKIVTPISNMILARLLAPEIFGIVASINMVLSFCDIFADAGFQKYVIQHEIDDYQELNKISTVAFWTNLSISVVIWIAVCAFASPIARLVGCEGYGFAVCIACIHLPLQACSSIPNARLKREMNFKTLFQVRLVSIFTPFVVTLPIALLTRSCWALIIGNLANNFMVALVAFIRVKWKPQFYFSMTQLKQMLSFSVWSTLEAILVWLINWGDMFIVGMFLSSHYLGIYKTSINMVNSILAVISSSLSPVMLSALSRLQGDNEQFKKVFYKISMYSGLLLLPMGVGMLVYRETMCDIVLGSAWSEGTVLMGIWGFISAIAILFNTYSGCVYIAKGKPKISAIVQICQIVTIIPAVYISAQMSFECLSYTRALIRIIGMVIHCFAVWKIAGISTFVTLKKLVPSIIATSVMAIAGMWFVSLEMGLLFEIASIIICAILYAGILCLFPNIRQPVFAMVKTKLVKRGKKE